MKKSEGDWDYVIKPKRGWFDLELGTLWRYRDLCRMYVHRNIVVSYKQTILGPIWYILQPLFTIGIFMFIFGGLADIPTEGVPQPLFYMAGLLLWNYFSDCFNNSSLILLNNSSVFGKVYFPRLVVPISTAFSSIGKFLIQFLLFIGIYLWCLSINASISINWTVVLLPLYLLMIALIGNSIGLIMASITYKYRDLQLIIPYVFQFFLYATPVVYPIDTVPERYRYFISLNPLTSIFESFKYGWFNTGEMDWGGLLYSSVFLLIILLISLIWFNRVSQNFMDTV